jgi:hypothetical protein
MPNLTLLDKNEFRSLEIKSPRDRQVLLKMLGRTGLSFKHEFIGELASKLNSTSFSQVLKNTYFTDSSLPGRNFAESFSMGFKATPLPGLSQVNYLQIAVENLNFEIERVKIAANCLLTHNKRISNLDDHVISPIRELVVIGGAILDHSSGGIVLSRAA